MPLLSDEVIERIKQKIPQLNTLTNMDYTIFGMVHIDIIGEDKSVKQLSKHFHRLCPLKIKIFPQLVLMTERLKVMEPEQNLKKSQIFADVYIKVKDKTLYQVAVKEISLDDALNDIKFYGDEEIWRYNIQALRKILPNEHFEVKNEMIKDEETVVIEKESIAEEKKPEKKLRIVTEELKFLNDAYNKFKNSSK